MSESSKDGHVMMPRTAPTMNVAAAIMSAASGVKSAVTSTRLTVRLPVFLMLPSISVSVCLARLSVAFIPTSLSCRFLT